MHLYLLFISFFIFEICLEAGPKQNPNRDLALKEVEKQISDAQLSRYRLAVAVLLKGNKELTNEKNFCELVNAAVIGATTYLSAISFTIEVLEGAGLGCEYTECLKPFASPQNALQDPYTDLSATVFKFYNGMADEKFNREKFLVLQTHSDKLDRCDFVIQLMVSNVIWPGNVSKIEGDSLFFEDYKARCKSELLFM